MMYDTAKAAPALNQKDPVESDGSQVLRQLEQQIEETYLSVRMLRESLTPILRHEPVPSSVPDWVITESSAPLVQNLIILRNRVDGINSEIRDLLSLKAI